MAANPQKRNALNPQGLANKERLQNAKEVQARKREAQLDSLSPDEVLLEPIRKRSTDSKRQTASSLLKTALGRRTHC